MEKVQQYRDSTGTAVISSRTSVDVHHLPDTSRRNAALRDIWTVEAHHEIDRLDEFEAKWRAFTRDAISPFLTFGWNKAWYRQYCSKDQPPLLLELLKNGETTAILPCYRKGHEIRLAGDEDCDYQDIVTGPEVTVGFALARFLDWLRREDSGSHFYFRKLSSEGKLFKALVEADVPPDHSIVFSKYFAPCPIVSISGGLDGYLSSFPRKIRQDLRRSLNRLGREAPEARVDIFRGTEITAGHLEKAEAFHCENFRKSGESPFADPRLAGMLGEVSNDPDVGLQYSRLSDRGETLAVDFGFVRNGRYFGYLTAFDSAFQKLAPGKCLLLNRMNPWAHEDGVEKLDFLSGDESYKRNFTNGEGYEVYSVRLMPDGLLHRIYRVVLVLDKKARSFAKWTLRKAGLRQ